MGNWTEWQCPANVLIKNTTSKPTVFRWFNISSGKAILLAGAYKCKQQFQF